MAASQAMKRSASVADAQIARIAAGGSATHAHCLALSAATGPEAARDLADAVHLLCSLYGRHPGLLDLALQNCPPGPIRDWLSLASESFERERLYLVRLTAAVGPLPSTPGAAQTESVLTQQRHAVETLARSERRGCALGATTALVADWGAIRLILDRAAARMGVEVPPSTLPGRDSINQAIEQGVDTLAAERALGFGGEQLLLQNRGLLDVLEARASARTDS